MDVGQGMIGRPVPMEQCKEAPVGSDAVLFIRPCPMCGKYFKQKAFCVTNCGCIYHPFCLGAHLELFKCSTCAGSTYNEIFDDDIIKLFGYHQYRIELAKVKSNKGHMRRRSLTPDSSTSRPYKFTFLYFMYQYFLCTLSLSFSLRFFCLWGSISACSTFMFHLFLCKLRTTSIVILFWSSSITQSM
jgi:hypothetical protein